MAIDLQLVLALSRDLQHAATLGELLEAAQRAVVRATRYRTSWIVAFESTPDGEWVRVLGVEGTNRRAVWEETPRFPVGKDAMLLEIREGSHPVVVEDMRTDPRSDKEIVARAGHRTTINVPMVIGNVVLGALGVSSFGDEGVMPPTPRELEHLTVFATLLAAAFDRVRLIEERAIADRQAAALEQRRRDLEAQLRKSQKLESLGVMAGGIAHDLNNILFAILAHSEIATGEVPADSSARESLGIIITSAQRAAQLTRDLLTFSRRQIVQFRPVQIRAAITQVTRMARPLLRDDVVLEVSLSREDLVVVADEGSLEQVIMNLVTNARDAMPRGGRLAISLAAVTIDDDFVLRHGGGLLGRCALLTVTDTGVGMDAATQARIFEPFFTTKAPGRGTGLGLSTVHSIVEQHGGLILCESEPGKGTTFRIYLPATTADTAVAGAAAGARPARGTETLLVAEDDEVVRALVVKLLRGQGYTVIEAADGEAAIERFREASGRIELVMTDAVMPKRSGLDVVKEVRKFRQDTKVLLTSGYAADVVDQQRLDAEGVELLPKPVRPTVLLETVRRLLDRKKAAPKK